MIRAYFRRGAHRVNRFSVRVADIAARMESEHLARRPGFREYVDDEGRVWIEWREAVTVSGFDSGAFLVVAPPTPRANFPVLFEGEVVADA
ncbi:hypothetical protein ACORG1_13260 [Mycobacterium sp. TJFP1]